MEVINNLPNFGALNPDISDINNKNVLHTNSCQNLSIHNESDTLSEFEKNQLRKQLSDDLGYFEYQNSLSFSTCSSASTNLNFIELTSKLDEIKQKRTENNTSNIIDILYECINTGNDYISNSTTCGNATQNLSYFTVTPTPAQLTDCVGIINPQKTSADDVYRQKDSYRNDKFTQTIKNSVNRTIYIDSADGTETMKIRNGTITIPCKELKLVLKDDHCEIVIE